MVKSSPTLDDKFDLNDTHQLLTGAQAIVRLVMMQQVRDKQAGLNTGGYVSGYRGSPLGAYDIELWRAKPFLEEHDIELADVEGSGRATMSDS